MDEILGIYYDTSENPVIVTPTGTTCGANHYIDSLNGALTTTNDINANKFIGSSGTFTSGVYAGKLRITSPTIPASGSASGVIGDIAYGSGYFYACTGTNKWGRVAPATW